MQGLEKINFTLNESKVYITLIKLGPSLAGAIAKEAHLDRSSTYNALKTLLQKGIVSTVFENKRTIFIPEKPKKIIDYYQEKEEIAKQIIPSLEAQFNVNKEKSSVKLFKGFKGVKTVFQNVIDTCTTEGTYYILGSEGQVSDCMPYYAKILRARKEQKKIHTKTLIRANRILKKKGKYTEYRSIPLSVVSPVTVNVYPGKLAIFIWGDQPDCVLIENPQVSKTFADYFEFMWKHANKKTTVLKK